MGASSKPGEEGRPGHSGGAAEDLAPLCACVMGGSQGPWSLPSSECEHLLGLSRNATFQEGPRGPAKSKRALRVKPGDDGREAGGAGYTLGRSCWAGGGLEKVPGDSGEARGAASAPLLVPRWTGAHPAAGRSLGCALQQLLSFPGVTEELQLPGEQLHLYRHGFVLLAVNAEGAPRSLREQQ